MTRVPDPAARRNVSCVGPAGAGTSTLVTALTDRSLWSAGLVVRTAGALALLDLPGSGELVAAREAGLHAAEGVLFVLGPGGVDPVTVALWDRCEQEQLPRAVVVTGLNREGADFDEAVAVAQRVFGEGVHPLHLPMHDDDEAVAGLVDLLTLRVHDWSSGRRVDRDPDPQHLPLVQTLHSSLVEAVLAQSEDDTLLDRYLADEPLDPARLTGQLHRAVAQARLHPVVAAVPATGVGTAELLELLVGGFPGPAERPGPVVSHADGSPAAPLAADPLGPPVAQVLQTDRGRALLRVHSGTVAGAAAGTFVVLADPSLRAGDTVSDPADPLRIAAWTLPEPQLPVALDLTADGATALQAAVADDPGARLERRADTGQLLLWVQGEEHLARLLGYAGVAATRAAVQVPTLVAADGSVLEPVSLVRVSAPPAYARTVASDLPSRGGRVLDTTREQDVVTVMAQVPDRSLLGYAVALRRLTHGTGTFTREPAGTRPAPE